MLRHLAATILVGLSCAALAPAQETTTGSVAGTVRDSQGGVLPGASVTLSSAQGSRTVVTNAQGRFLAPYLTPGTYDVRVELSGFKTATQSKVLVRLGQRLELPFTLEVGTITETIHVVAQSPVVDTSSTTTGGVLESDQLARLPVARRLSETLYMVPGVSSSTGAGRVNPSIAGASGLDNQYVVDGVNITNQGWGSLGVFSLFFGSLGSGVTTDFIQETEVKTGGFEAEYGQATGGVVNVITRSGNNTFHGSVFGYFRPPDLEASWRQLQTNLGQVNTTGTQNVDFGVTAGGPILRDRLFYFAAFNPQYETRRLIAPEGFPLRSLGEVEQKRRNLSYAGKLTWQVTGSHRIDFTAFGDPSYGAPGPQRGTSLLAQDTTQFSELSRYGGNNQALRYSAVLSRGWLVEATAAHARTMHVENPTVDERRVVDRTVVPNVVTGGVGRYEGGNDGRSLQLALKSTLLFDAAGSHEVRFGVEHEDIDFTVAPVITGPRFTFPDGTTSFSGVALNVVPDAAFGGTLGSIYRVSGFTSAAADSTQKYLSWFAQDTWRIGRRLTLRPGLRWERQHLAGGRPLCFSDAPRVGAPGTPGHEILCSYTWTNNWAPRLGATFDLTGEGRSKLFASWGRYYAKMPNDIASRGMGSAPSTAVADYYDAGLTQPVPDGVLALGTTRHFVTFDNSPSEFANGSRLTYHDELVVGAEVEAAPLLNVGLRYIHRSLPRVLEDYSAAQMVLYDLGYPGLDQVIYLVDNITARLPTIDPSSIGVPQAFYEDPVHRYDAIELTAQKAFSGHWSLFASYRWSRLRGNFEGFYRSDNGQADPAITSLFDFPTNDPSYTEIGTPEFGYQGDIRYQGTTLGVGPLPNDRTHQVKIYGTYTWGAVNAGLAFRAGSGQPLTALAANPNYGDSGEIPVTLRGAGFQTVDGFKKRSPAIVVFDLHLDYTLHLAARRLMLLADVFNLLNNQDPVSYNPDTQIAYPVDNPDFGVPWDPASTVSVFETPRQIRLGARFEW
jgi:hypothetical protein